MKQLIFINVLLVAAATACTADTFEKLKSEAVNRERLIIWDDDGCDMTHYPYQRADLAKQPASVRNFELMFLEATENTWAVRRRTEWPPSLWMTDVLPKAQTQLKSSRWTT